MNGEEGVWGALGWGCGGLVVNTSDSGSRVAVLCP